MSIFLWVLIGFAAYSFVLVPVLMELALDSPKRTKNGEIRIKKGFVIRNFYKKNFLFEDKNYPRDICQFYRGMYVGTLYTSFMFPVISIFLALFYIVWIPIAIIMGYMPRCAIKFWTKDGDEHLFYEYERIGNKKWIAPWKFIVSVGLGFLIYVFHGKIYQGLMEVLLILSSKVSIIVYGSIAGLIFLIILINKIRKTESFVVSKEVAGSFFKKFCKKIESD